MFNVLFTLFIASEFCYYLLIAQTGIVEVFHSDISAFFTLPLGGIIGSLLVYRPLRWLKNDQAKMSFLYRFTALMLTVLPFAQSCTLGGFGH